MGGGAVGAALHQRRERDGLAATLEQIHHQRGCNLLLRHTDLDLRQRARQGLFGDRHCPAHLSQLIGVFGHSQLGQQRLGQIHRLPEPEFLWDVFVEFVHALRADRLKHLLLDSRRRVGNVGINY